MRIKTAGRRDLARIKELLESCQLYHADINGDAKHHFLLAFKEKALTGSVGIEVCGDAALLRSLAVTPRHRCKGVGAELVNAIESHARSQKVKTLYLLTLTAADFFAKRGYRITERAQAPAKLQDTTEFKSICPVSAVCMTKNL